MTGYNDKQKFSFLKRQKFQNFNQLQIRNQNRFVENENRISDSVIYGCESKNRLDRITKVKRIQPIY